MVRISHQPTKPTIALRQNPKGEKILHHSHVRLSYLAGFLFPLNFTFGCTRFFVQNDITASTANFTQRRIYKKSLDRTDVDFSMYSKTQT